MHYALITTEANIGLRNLRRGLERITIRIPIESLVAVNQNFAYKYVRMTDKALKTYTNPMPITGVVLCLQHHCGKKNEPHANPHIFTFYPF